MEEKRVMEIPIENIVPNPYQPRKVFSQAALEELSNSIKVYGILQPITVRQIDDNYELIAGERRFRAAKLANLQAVPAIINNMSDESSAVLALLENLQRENLTAIEEATAYKKLQETLGLTQEELAKRLGKSRSHITNMLGLLTLPDTIQEDISAKKITMGHARVISKLDDYNQQQELVEKVINEGISVRQLEELAKETEIIKTNPQKPRIEREDNEYAYVQEAMSEKLGTKVVIKKNKIEISFVNGNDLNRLLEYMNIEVGR
jgi:ParB family chromosome partitioning protein